MNQLILDQPRRSFQVWRYSVSHGLLMLRSNMDGDFRTRIDLLFGDVYWIKIPTLLRGVRIREASEGEVNAIARSCRFETKEWRRGYLLSGSDYDGYVIAASLDLDEGRYEEHDLDKWELTAREQFD